MDHFGLNWIGKERSLAAAVEGSNASLIPRNEASSNDPKLAHTTHEVIEGDNFEVLCCLRTRDFKADLIYIDPPYNTGNAFIYSDKAKLTHENMIPEVDQCLTPQQRSHSAWLSLMYSRLLVARDLLSTRGSIWVSIDDHELGLLQVMMREIFGEENHIATIITCLNPKGRQLGRFAINHEYLLVFSKEISQCELKYATKEAVNPKDFRHQDERGYYRYLPLRNSNKRFNPVTRPTLYYPLYVETATGRVSAEFHSGWTEVYPLFGSGERAVWRWSKKKVTNCMEQLEGSLIKGRLGSRWDVRQKDYNSEQRTKKLKTVWTSDEIGSTDEAAREIKSLGLALFETPKPTRLLRRILSLSPKDSIVLDFFAGSGTTGEATLRQNLSDGGTRRFILVESGNKTKDDRFETICAITRTRVKAVKSRIGSEIEIRGWNCSPLHP